MEPISWRAPIWGQIPYAVGLGALIGLCLLITLINPHQPYSLLVLALVVLTIVGEARRTCRIDEMHLVARGRFSTRTVELRDLRQVGQGSRGIWIRTHQPLDARGNDVLSLRMIPTTGSDASGGPAGEQAVRAIREHAAAIFARLDPPLTAPTQPPTKKPLIFSS